MGKDDDHARRLATLEAICSNTIPRIEKFMEEGHTMRTQNAERMVRIEGNVMNFTKYQQTCDNERVAHGKDIQDIKNTTSSLVASRRRQLFIVLSIPPVIGWLTDGGAKMVIKALGIFDV